MEYCSIASLSSCSSIASISSCSSTKPNLNSIWYRAKRSNVTVACLVALILFTDMLVYGAVVPCLPALVIDKFHGTPRDIGILFACFALGYLVSTPIFAIISDKYQNRRYPLILGVSCLITSTLCFAYASNYTTLVIARICQGASAGASWTVGLGMLADTFAEERLGTVMGTVIMSHTIGFVLGPVLGGVLYDHGGTLAPFYFCSLFGLLTLIGVLWIEEPINTASKSIVLDESSSLLPAKKGQMFQLIKNRRIIACVICCFVTSAALSGIEPALPIYLQEKYHVSISVVGVVFIALVLPSFLGPVMGYLSDKFGRTLFIGTGMFSMTIALILVSLPVTSIYSMVPSLLLFGLSNPLIHTPLMPEMGSIVSEMGSNAFAQGKKKKFNIYLCILNFHQ
ncbi:hypothetical protein INT48_000999 [Thamnidium elegans]|uniref:Major facilitator superfamily (MFS) profile domain-containing protein n=1 Tax=Thamnidium elegans TaxID=101142 RepID=A0A8H7SWM6_9FUNG|nr:hypothetical protein INT48_000999 [Thamnidium elegans]